MSNINQINPKIFTSNQINPATLTSKMQEFIRVENQVRIEINSIQQKKDRFREWTKSLGESPKIQEMFTKFDVRIQALFQKLDQFTRQREELTAGFLSDTVYTPVVGDTLVQERIGDSQNVQDEIKSSPDMKSEPEIEKVIVTISETESVPVETGETESISNQVEPEVASEEPTSQSEMEKNADDLTIAEIRVEKTTEMETVAPEVPEEIDEKILSEEPVPDTRSRVEKSFAEPLLPEVNAHELEADQVIELVTETISPDQIDEDIKVSESDIISPAELLIENRVDSSDLKAEEEVIAFEQSNETDDLSKIDGHEVQSTRDDQEQVSMAVESIPTMTIDDEAAELQTSAETTDVIEVGQIKEEIPVIEAPFVSENLACVESQEVEATEDEGVVEPIAAQIAPESLQLVETDDIKLAEESVESSPTVEELAEIDAQTLDVESSEQVCFEPVVTTPECESAALIFEIADNESAETVPSTITKEPGALQLGETTIETQTPIESGDLENIDTIIFETAPESISDADILTHIADDLDKSRVKVEFDSDIPESVAEEQANQLAEVATDIFVSEKQESKKQNIAADLNFDTDMASDNISVDGFVDEIEKNASGEEKTVLEAELDTETLSFEINENILAEAINRKYEDYEEESINDESDLAPFMPTESESESQPVGNVVPEGVEDSEKSVDILEMIPEATSEDEIATSIPTEELEGTEFIAIEIPPASDVVGEESLAEETPVDSTDRITIEEGVDLIDVIDTNEEESSTPQNSDKESVEYFFGSKDIRRPRPIELTNEEKEYKDRMPKLPRDIFEKKFSRGRVEVPSESEIKQSNSEVDQKKNEEVTEGTRLEKLFNVKKIKSRFSLRKLMKTKEEEEAMEMERDVNQPETPVTNYETEDMKIVEEKTEVSKPVHVDDKTVLYLGIDLGTSETTVAASNGVVETILSVIGKPKDVISQKLLKKDILFGLEALRNRLALSIYRPLEKGVIKDTDSDLEAARELVKYVISLAAPEKYDKVYAVIGAPARSSFANQQALMDAAREVVDAVMIVSEPFAVAYGEGKIYNSLIIDIGAGTTDICSLKGSMPNDEDQFTLLKAGDYIDNHLMDTIKNRIQGAQITKELCKKWKEEYSYVIEPEKTAVASINIEGKPAKVDITKDIQASCESIMPDIVTCINSIVANFDPEFQEELKQNIILAGGGSLIKNIDQYLERALRSLGNVKVSRVVNPIEAGARGALNLAKDLTDDYWRAL
ncbi:rod shape-determining protein [candidate division KSB1 bacterium]|nr:rod shape-determining protein [candidate division KSB1 bacterium]